MAGRRVVREWATSPLALSQKAANQLIVWGVPILWLHDVQYVAYAPFVSRTKASPVRLRLANSVFRGIS